MTHKINLENLYHKIKFPDAIDWWASHFAQDRLDISISNARHLDFTRQKLENRVWQQIVPEGGKVADIACGRGFFIKRLLEALDVKADIVGLDLSETILRIAQAEQKGIPFVLATAEEIPLRAEMFDVVFLISAVEQIEFPDPVLREIFHILKPGGHLYLCLHKPYLDPFILPTVTKKAIQLMRLWVQRKNQKKQDIIGYKGSLRELRQHLKDQLTSLGFESIETKALIYKFEWLAYKKVIPGAIPHLMRVGQWLNRLPFSYYKDLEYWLLKKP